MLALAETASKALYFAVISDVACAADGAIACSAPPDAFAESMRARSHLSTRIQMPHRSCRLGVQAEQKRRMGATFSLHADEP